MAVSAMAPGLLRAPALWDIFPVDRTMAVCLPSL
jgi:hypothetical protein